MIKFKAFKLSYAINKNFDYISFYIFLRSLKEKNMNKKYKYMIVNNVRINQIIDFYKCSKFNKLLGFCSDKISFN
jgi:hypothetical protein